MDPVSIALATAVAGGLGGKIGEALADGGLTTLTRLRKVLFPRLRSRPDSSAALDAAQTDPSDDAAVRVLAGHIVDAEAAEPGIAPVAAELRELLAESGGTVTNTVNGDVSGTVIQGRDFHGDLRFDR
ncbi:hypothetical protein CLV63_10844 [Murinocardiopsis flavida]|uniref:Uncharacterized protein n=1 Tax=Murinocardiopsis flavida TaxID=645275 RepID=A0A2P8DJC7_9ACTN|nr:hypothetical protein [Murinocardiopsis flavida]PSK97326.1 hypothetical protein CLV63_10844 [Murinocardiopsis flavida]